MNILHLPLIKFFALFRGRRRCVNVVPKFFPLPKHFELKFPCLIILTHKFNRKALSGHFSKIMDYKNIMYSLKKKPTAKETSNSTKITKTHNKIIKFPTITTIQSKAQNKGPNAILKFTGPHPNYQRPSSLYPNHKLHNNNRP